MYKNSILIYCKRTEIVLWMLKFTSFYSWCIDEFLLFWWLF